MRVQALQQAELFLTPYTALLSKSPTCKHACSVRTYTYLNVHAQESKARR